jgi:hypothetical protein
VRISYREIVSLKTLPKSISKIYLHYESLIGPALGFLVLFSGQCLSGLEEQLLVRATGGGRCEAVR